MGNKIVKKDFLGGNGEDNGIAYYFRTKHGAVKELHRLNKSKNGLLKAKIIKVWLNPHKANVKWIKAWKLKVYEV